MDTPLIIIKLSLSLVGRKLLAKKVDTISVHEWQLSSLVSFMDATKVSDTS